MTACKLVCYISCKFEGCLIYLKIAIQSFRGRVIPSTSFIIISTNPCENKQFICTNNFGSFNVALILDVFLRSVEFGSV